MTSDAEAPPAASDVALSPPRGGPGNVDLVIANEAPKPDPEKLALELWAEQVRLPLNCEVAITRGTHKRRRARVVPWGQGAKEHGGLVLVALFPHGTLAEQLVRVPLSFVRKTADPPKPAPSAFGEGGSLDLSRLWSHASGKLAYTAG